MTDFDLYLFDFDGTIVNSEPIHYRAYHDAFQTVKPDFDLTYEEYCRYKHGDDSYLIDLFFTDQEKEKVIKEKERLFIKYAPGYEFKLIDGFDVYLEKLLTAGKTVCIVTHSPIDRINIIKQYVPILNKIEHWVTKEQYKNRKPHPESYMTAINKFKNILPEKIIAFEDTLIGHQAIAQLNGVTSVFIGSSDYVYYNDIMANRKFKNYFEFLEQTINPSC